MSEMEIRAWIAEDYLPIEVSIKGIYSLYFLEVMNCFHECRLHSLGGSTLKTTYGSSGSWDL